MPERASFRQLLRNYLRSVPPARLAKVFAEEYVGTFLRALPGVEGFVLRYLLYRVLFERLDGFCYLYPGARLSHTYGISAGRNLMVNAGAFLYGRGGLRFGDDVMIGPNAVIVSSQHRFDDPRIAMVYQGHKADFVDVGSDVWIGANAVILPGVRVADGTVVSAGAVVTRDTEPYSIVGGIPAARIGMRPRLCPGAGDAAPPVGDESRA
jgi:acetyltransferase-like isoleucine patch superfamily enzyme